MDFMILILRLVLEYQRYTIKEDPLLDCIDGKCQRRLFNRVNTPIPFTVIATFTDRPHTLDMSDTIY